VNVVGEPYADHSPQRCHRQLPGRRAGGVQEQV